MADTDDSFLAVFPPMSSDNSFCIMTRPRTQCAVCKFAISDGQGDWFQCNTCSPEYHLCRLCQKKTVHSAEGHNLVLKSPKDQPLVKKYRILQHGHWKEVTREQCREFAVTRKKNIEASSVRKEGDVLVISLAGAPPNASKKDLKPITYKDALLKKGGQLEAWHQGDRQLLQGPSYNPFVSALHVAFCYHLPVELSPDSVWIAIAQGFAKHVNQNAEKLRHLFVSHKGKADIKIRLDHFQKGNSNNPWPEAFQLFSSEIGKHVGEIKQTLTADFSTTSPLSKIVSEIVLMEAFKEYVLKWELFYGYKIRLRGTLEDWKKVREKAAQLEKYDLHWWIPELLKVLDQFISIYTNPIITQDVFHFWASIYKFEDATTGWINVLMPYLATRRNVHLPTYSVVDIPGKKGVDPSEFPSGLSVAPFTWEYLTKEFPMEFRGGFIGISQDESTHVIRAELGWGVFDNSEAKKT